MDEVKGFRLTSVNDKPHFHLFWRQCRGLLNSLGTSRPSFQLCFLRLFWGRVFQPWRQEVVSCGCNEQSPFAGRRPSRWMHFPSLHPLNLGSFRVLGLHPSDLILQSGSWANLFPWGWLRLFRMREQNECFCWSSERRLVGPQDAGQLLHPLSFGSL